MNQSIAAKVQEYETFLNNTLREDLKYLENKLKEINDKLTKWYLLQKSINDIKEHHPKGFKTYTDLGCGISCKVNVTDPSVILVNIGLNVYMQMTLDEAIKYCDFKINIYKKEVEHIQKQATKVKAHIKMVLLGVQELQEI